MGRGVELGYIIPLTGQTGKLKKLDKLEMDWRGRNLPKGIQNYIKPPKKGKTVPLLRFFGVFCRAAS